MGDRFRIKLVIQYKGTNYHGWQTQPNGATIQKILEEKLSRILNTSIKVVGSGRTDAGVHALGQVCHFDLPMDVEWSRNNGKLKRFVLSLNSLLPADIVILAVKSVSNSFHAQKSAKKKSYDYYIFNSPLRNPFLEEYSWQVASPLSIGKMRRGAKILIGEHDFRAFCASGSSVKTTVRKVYGITIHPPPLIRISITGNGFLKQMVRNIVGTLVDVGKGKTTLFQFRKILKSRDRRLAGKTAPAKGLFLRRVEY